MAYATIGWNCECYRRGNKIKNTRDRYNIINNVIRYDRESSGAIKSKYFMPKNTIKMKAGFESKISEKFSCEASIGLSIGHHYYAASGDIGAIYSF
jgi:outer membrane autotransporter protein